MSYRSKIKICGIKSAAEARTVLACSSALCENLERANDAKNLPQSGGENSAYRAQNHANFTPEQNSNCDKNFGSGSRSQRGGSSLRVEFLGVIFVSSSKRRVSIETAREIARIAHESGAKCVGVFALSSAKHSATACENFRGKACGDEICKDKIYVSKSGGVEFYEAAEFCEKQRDDLNVNLNANCVVSASIKDLNSEILDAEALDEEQILKICSLCELDCAQIYGRISADFKARLNAAGIEAWQVLSIGAEMPLLEGLSCDRILFDAKGANLGGNGVSFDWDLLRRAGLGCEGQYSAARDEKNCAGSATQSIDDTRGDFERNAICENFGEEKFYAECVENSGAKPINSRDRRAVKDDEASLCAHAFARSNDVKFAREKNGGHDAKSEECRSSAYATSQSIGAKPVRKGVDDCGANDYEAGAPNITNGGGEVGKSGAAKDDSADERSTASKGGAISFILAGGIGAQNILEALALRPYAIDLNSRVEDARGIKDPQKISEILRIIESADGAAD